MLTLTSLKIAVEKEFDSRNLASTTRYRSLRNVVAFIKSQYNGDVSCLEMDKKVFLNIFCDNTGYSMSGSLKGAVNELYNQYNLLKDANDNGDFSGKVISQPVESKSPKVVKIPNSSYNNIEGFPPLIDDNAEILVLGTAPGTDSLRLGQYYASKNNKFWNIISTLFNNGITLCSYEDKVKCLHDNHIALWDVYKSCDRVKCADSSIRNQVANDIEGLLKRYPSIKKIVLNGNKAAEGFHASVPYVKAISTAAYVTVQDKVNEWKTCLMCK